LTVLDAPSQRFYAIGLYAVLFLWKLYDWVSVAEEGEGSWGMFLKWIVIDIIYLFGLPELRIPWLEWSQTFVTGVYCAHVVIDWLLMFLVPLPLIPGLLAFVKVFYDREISVSEHNVKVSSILNNHSLIMGKQIINILPEGSAVLNPDSVPFCLPESKSKVFVSLPIHFNATIPAEIELIRTDIHTLKEEVIKIPKREVGKLAKLVRDQNADPANDGFRWEYPIRKTGIYRLGKVLDDYMLEVQRSSKDTYVVPCPQARFQAAQSSSRCIRDLSDLSLEVSGTPPLKIVYSRTINGKNHSFHFQSLQPDGFTSPLIGSTSTSGPDELEDLSWVRPSKITVGLNESMNSAGEWQYTVDEVHDAFGNTVLYNEVADESQKPKSRDLSHSFSVKERPKIKMNKCDLKSPLKIAKGSTGTLPVGFSLPGPVDDTSHTVTWAFSPIDSLTNSGDHGELMTIGSYPARNSRDLPPVSQPGLYTLRSVTSGQCEGQVEEPSSCLVLNPLEPHLSLRAEEISDSCAGNPIGLRVDLDFVGTPPFDVHYEVIETVNGKRNTKKHRVNALRSQLELVPKEAGHYQYVFKSIDDSVYKNVAVTGSDKTLEQVVKPAANALFSVPGSVSACLDEEVEKEVYLYGDPPFNLEWEIVHDGKRKTYRVNDIPDRTHKIKTAPLNKGGEYNLALSSVQDARGCRTFLQEQLKVNVRLQRPRAAFGTIEQKRSIMAVQDTHIRVPLRLQGEGPWKIGYRNIKESDDIIYKSISGPNDILLVKSSGVYEIASVSDNQCPGIVDTSANKFEVDWFPRPELSMVESESVRKDSEGVFVKQDVCEGDIDGFEISLKGSPPYNVQYEVKHKPAAGSGAISRKNFDAAFGKAGVSMDTSRPGDYTYRFSGLADNLYNTDRAFTPLVVRQRVNAKPSAAFAKPGQSFKYCAQEQEYEDKIPIKLTGVAPFYVEIEIKHQAGSAPETYSIPAIHSVSHGIQIPREHLRRGTQQVRIRRVRDARGCQQKYEIGGPSIQVQVFDAPSIYPLESREDYCVGERIGFTLSGTPPFDISYEFNGRWNAKSQTTNFRRVAEKPGVFTINSVSDKASECRAAVSIPKTIHPLPSVRISQGRQSRVDIHEGGEVDIQFEFWGTPPFEFTYTRSSNAKKGQKSVILETQHDVSFENKKVVKASQEGTYEVVAIKDKYCSFSTQQVAKKDR